MIVVNINIYSNYQLKMLNKFNVIYWYVNINDIVTKCVFKQTIVTDYKYVKSGIDIIKSSKNLDILKLTKYLKKYTKTISVRLHCFLFMKSHLKSWSL